METEFEEFADSFDDDDDFLDELDLDD